VLQFRSNLRLQVLLAGKFRRLASRLRVLPFPEVNRRLYGDRVLQLRSNLRLQVLLAGKFRRLASRLRVLPFPEVNRRLYGDRVLQLRSNLRLQVLNPAPTFVAWPPQP
jgi:hypothetical protein